MEVHNKRSMKILSVAQIVLSVIFFTLGMVDGFHIRYRYVSLLFTPCWMTALVSRVRYQFHLRKPRISRDVIVSLDTIFNAVLYVV